MQLCSGRVTRVIIQLQAEFIEKVGNNIKELFFLNGGNSTFQKPFP